ncbi:hypothetical protein DAI22_07g028500 [Oryza sativa Japonica Group]|nr:hypothetical protein DAI22_07g028500 [Oryza sativa Japonica Group]
MRVSAAGEGRRGGSDDGDERRGGDGGETASGRRGGAARGRRGSARGLPRQPPPTAHEAHEAEEEAASGTAATTRQITEDITKVHINKIITRQITAAAATSPFVHFLFYYLSCSSHALTLLLLVGFLWSQLQFGAEAAGTTVFTLCNNCTYTVWPTTLSGNTAVGGHRGRRLQAIARRQRLIPSPGWLVRPLMGAHGLCTLRHRVPCLRHGVLRRRRELLPRRRAARHPRRVHAGRRRREGLLRREPRGRRPTGESARRSSPRRTRSAPRRPSPPPTRSFSPHRCRVAPRRPPTPSSSRRLSQRREREMRRETRVEKRGREEADVAA